ncbi:MAG: undecaprenyl-diphosphate phosphatase [Verrucomicrobiota bacterium]
MKDLLILAALALASGPLAAQEPEVSATPEMNLWQAGVLGIVEGLTEYLPISSTGHLIVTQRFLGIPMDTPERKQAADAYAISIQGGAILAVLGLYFPSVRRMALGLLGRDPEGLRLALALVVAFLPAVAIGLAFNHIIKEYLFGLWPVVMAWIVGGILILVLARKPKAEELGESGTLPVPTLRQSLLIGLFQCVAMWPGTSRSLMVIVGGLLVGLSMRRSVEFSFLLGLLTLGAATCKDAVEFGPLMLATYGWGSLLVGGLAALISAVFAVKWMVGYLNRHGLQLFGWYRIAVGLLVASLIWAGWFEGLA